MATKPTSKPEWATDSENDAVTGAPNKLEPTPEFKASGLKAGQPTPRPFLNYQFDNIREWVDYFEEELATLVADGATTTLQAVYPVGSYYTSNASTDPSTLFGFGTWTRVKGRFIVGLDELDVDFDGAGETGGAKTHTHSDNLSIDGHVLTVSELPAHSHSYVDRYYAEASGAVSTATNKETMPTNYNNKLGSGDTDSDNNTFLTYQGTTSVVGSNTAHTHNLSGGVQSASSLPPYRTAYVWYRSA